MARTRDHRRAGVPAVLAAFLLTAIAGTAGCGAGGEEPSARPSAGAPTRSAERTATGEPDPTRTRTERTPVPTRTATSADDEAPAPTRTSRSPEPGGTTTRPTATTAATPARTTAATAARTTDAAPAPAPTTTRPPTTTTAATPEPAETTPPTTPAQSASAAAVTGGSSGLGPFGWLVLLVLAAGAVVGAVLVARSQRRSAWDTEARALESETRAVATVRLPPVLSTTTTGRRGLAWTPVRADLTTVLSRWIDLTERASGEARRNWSMRISGLLQELIAAVDAENEALAAGPDWLRLRPAVHRAENALAAVLAGRPPEPPPAGEPGSPAFQT
jgi:hypothetical protein